MPIKLYVENLSQYTTEGSVRTAFEKFGNVRHIELGVDGRGMCNGTAILTVS